MGAVEAVAMVVIALIGGAASIIAAVFAHNSQKTSSDVRRQIKTNHGSAHLGDATDRLTVTLAEVSAKVDGVRSDQAAIRRDVAQLRAEVLTDRQHLNRLTEATGPASAWSAD
ncbi:MAG: hypothetical protein LBK54_10230 [Propionibacteriaceae bacterium]|jgi:cell division protein FtsI/penicillin-binding protein 2|nr:hypothetical protein [Propionibacteriaceae bacterium]